MPDVGVQSALLRSENVSALLKGFALQEYRMRELVMVESSSSDAETYFKETAADLEGGAGNAIKGVPRLAAFPNLDVSWNKATAYNLKYGGQASISYEDEKMASIAVVARTLLRVARAITKSVDTEIWNTLTENQSPSTINFFGLALGYEWNASTISQRDPINDILKAKRLIEEDNYDLPT